MLNPGDTIVIVMKERNAKTGRIEEIVSHGIDPETNKDIILPSEPPHALGAVFDHDIREYVIRSPVEGMRSQVSRAEVAATSQPRLSLTERLVALSQRQPAEDTSSQEVVPVKPQVSRPRG